MHLIPPKQLSEPDSRKRSRARRLRVQEYLSGLKVQDYVHLVFARIPLIKILPIKILIQILIIKASYRGLARRVLGRVGSLSTTYWSEST